MTSAESSIYSIWLVPNIESELKETLQTTINSTALQLGTPSFFPHVTLIGGIMGTEKDVTEKASQVARKLHPYKLSLGVLESNGTYFQMVFSIIDQTPEVLNAYAIAAEIYKVTDVYFPHLSLAYGTLSDECVLNQVEKLGGKNIYTGHSFIATTLEVWKTEGAVETWQKVTEFNLFDT